MDNITNSPDTLTDELETLVARWERIAKRRFEDAEAESENIHKRFLTNAAFCYFNCANELRTVLFKAIAQETVNATPNPTANPKPRTINHED